MQIITNNIPRAIIYGFELTEKERAEFDYYESDELDSATFFRYKRNVYDLGEFSRVPDCANQATEDEFIEFRKWDGYQSDSFFSGIVVKYVDSLEGVIVGWYCS